MMRNNQRKSNIKREEAQNFHLREKTNIELRSHQNLILSTIQNCVPNKNVSAYISVNIGSWKEIETKNCLEKFPSVT